MANTKYNPTFKPVPLSISGGPAKKSEVPPELKELDNKPVAGLATTVGGNQIGELQPNTDRGDGVGFTAFADGLLARFIEQVDPKTGQSRIHVVDSNGKTYCIALNVAVADMICNGINALHLANVMRLQEERAAAENAAGGATVLQLPPSGN